MFLPLIIIFVVLTSAYSAQNYHPGHLSRTWTRLQLSLLFKVKKFWLPAKREKGKAVHTTFLYISLLLLSLSLDIESNSGPIQTQIYLEGNSTVFPCGSCDQPVTWSCKGVECDACFLWYHADCQIIYNSMYKITHNLIAIPISDFLIPLVRPSRHYHLLSYRLITAVRSVTANVIQKVVR